MRRSIPNLGPSLPLRGEICERTCVASTARPLSPLLQTCVRFNSGFLQIAPRNSDFGQSAAPCPYPNAITLTTTETSKLASQ